MKALIVIDMQVGMLDGETVPHDLDNVVDKINTVAEVIRGRALPVIFIQHHGATGEVFAVGESGWQVLPSIQQAPSDVFVPKTICDAFYGSNLDALLKKTEIDHLLISGWATDFCVDTTIRAAISREYDVTVIADAHTARDRLHLDAASIIEHHNRTWCDLLVPRGRQVRVVPAESIVRSI